MDFRPQRHFPEKSRFSPYHQPVPRSPDPCRDEDGASSAGSFFGGSLKSRSAVTVRRHHGARRGARFPGGRSWPSSLRFACSRWHRPPVYPIEAPRARQDVFRALRPDRNRSAPRADSCCDVGRRNLSALAHLSRGNGIHEGAGELGIGLDGRPVGTSDLSEFGKGETMLRGKVRKMLIERPELRKYLLLMNAKRFTEIKGTLPF